MPSRLAILVLVSTVVAGGTGAYAVTSFETPEFEIKDPADVESIGDNETDLSTTLTVNNRAGYPIPTDLVGGEYDVIVDNVLLLEGELEFPRLSTGNNTVTINSTLENNEIPNAWRAYLKNDETTDIELQANFSRVGPVEREGIFSKSITRTVGEDKEPVEEAFTSAVKGLEGNYTSNVSSSRITGGLTGQEAEVGYRIRDARVEVAEIGENETVLHMKMSVYNPSRVFPVPAEPDVLGVSMEANNVTLVNARSQDSTLVNRNDFESDSDVDGPVILPQQEKTVVYRLELNNNNIDDWFVSHLETEEYTYLESDFQFVFSQSGVEYRVPQESPVQYNCDVQTNFFYENKTQNVSCSDSTQQPNDENDGESSEDNNDTTFSNQEPVPEANITPRSGSAPLDVTLDGSESYDTDGSIESYEWTVVGLGVSREGAVREVTVPFPDEYEVKLIVTDEDGNTNTTTTTVTVS